MNKKSMTFKTAIRRASEIRVYVSCGTGKHWIVTTAAAIRRSHLYENAPTGHHEVLGGWTGWVGRDQHGDGDAVWSFALGLLQIGAG